MRLGPTVPTTYVITIGDRQHQVDRATYEATQQRERRRLVLIEQQRRRYLWPRMRWCPTCGSSRVFVRQVASQRHVPRCGLCQHRLGWWTWWTSCAAAAAGRRRHR